MGRLVVFNGISALVGYLIPNPLCVCFINAKFVGNTILKQARANFIARS